jgi:hypothetical protein
LPTLSLIPQLPTIGVPAQATICLRVRQQNLLWQRPKAVGKAQQNTERTGPERYREKKQRTQREKLGQKIRRQQLP